MIHRRQLAIAFARSSPREMFDLMDAFLTEGWSRADDEEGKWSPSLKNLQACYRCDARDDRPAAYLVICWSADDRLSAGKVFSADSRGNDSPVAVWNVVVADFHRRCLSAIDEQTMERLGLKIGLFSEEVSVADLLPGPLFGLLEAATATMNDEPWLDFFVALSRSPHRLTSELLGLWLLERGWNEGIVEMYVRRFEFAERLLRHAARGEADPG